MNIQRFLWSTILVLLVILLGVQPQSSFAKCYTDVSDPELTLIAEIPYNGWTTYVLGINNKNELPTPMFLTAPDYLQPCGMNYSSSRTWASIHDAATGKRLYGHCGIRNPPDLDDIRIGELNLGGACEVYVDFHDRLCDDHYVTNTINLCSTCLVIDSVCDPNATWNNHGEYLECVNTEANRLLAEGYFPSQDKVDECVAAAAESIVGQ